MKLLLVGSSGLVGQNVLRLALNDPRIEHIIAPVRRQSVHNPKLLMPEVDFNNLPADAPWWGVDAVICTLGTTIKVAGSEEAFRRVDLEYPLAVARHAKQHGASAYVLNSAHGASLTSPILYYRVKGELEHALTELGFSSLSYIRPGFIGGKRREFRLGERIMLFALSVLKPILPRKFRISPAENIAHALIESAVIAVPGIHVVSSQALSD